MKNLGLTNTEDMMMSIKYRICYFAFNECDDSKNPDIFDRYCNRGGHRCPVKLERTEENNTLNNRRLA